MSNPIGGDRVKQTAEAEHIGPDYTGDNISAKKVANYNWNGSTWERQSVGFANNANVTTDLSGGSVITQTDGTKTLTITISGSTITEVWS
jgi:hypothetical protein